jgi:tetratricopeptide (TPR) repeat protein
LRESVVWLEEYANESRDVELLLRILPPRLAVAVSARERTQVLLRAGDLLRADDRLHDAVRCFEGVLEDAPGSPVALRALRELYQDLGKSDRAIAVAEREGHLSQHPANASELLVQAGKIRESERWHDREALEDYLAALERHPADEEAVAAVRRICERTARWAELVAALEARAARLPDRRMALSLDAAELRARRMDDAEGAAALVTSITPALRESDAHSLRRAADLLAELERWPDAVALYEALREVTPDPDLRRAVSFRLVAIHRHKAPNTAAARAALERLVEENPDSVEALEALATLFSEEGQPAEARQALARAAEAESSPARACELWRRLSEMQSAAEDEAGALASVEHALAAAPEEVPVLEPLAELCAQLAQPDRVRSVLERAIAVAGGDEAARLRRQMVLLMARSGAEPQEVEAPLVLALAREPDDPELRALHAALLAREPGRAEDALAARRWLVTRHPLSPDGLRALGRLGERVGKTDLAYEIARLLTALGLGGEDEARVVRGLHPSATRWPDRALQEADTQVLWAHGAGDRLAEAVVTVVRRLPELVRAPSGDRRAGQGGLKSVADRVLALSGASDLKVAFDDRALGEVWRDGSTVCFSAELAGRPAGEQAFHLGAGIAQARRRVDLLSRWTARSVQGLLAAAIHAAGHPLPPGVPRQAVEVRAAQLQTRYADRLDAGLVKALGRASDAMRTLDVQVSVEDLISRSHRFGLLFAGGPPPAVAALTRQAGEGARPRDAAGVAALARWLISEEHLALRQRLGMAVRAG